MAARPQYFLVTLSRTNGIAFSEDDGESAIKLTNEERVQLLNLLKGNDAGSLFMTRKKSSQNARGFYTCFEAQDGSSVKSNAFSCEIKSLPVNEYTSLTQSLPKEKNTFSLLIETDSSSRITHIALFYCGKFFGIGLGVLDTNNASITLQNASKVVYNLLNTILNIIVSGNYKQEQVYHQNDRFPITINNEGMCVKDNSWNQFKSVIQGDRAHRSRCLLRDPRPGGA